MAQFIIDKVMIYERPLMREGEIGIGRHTGDYVLGTAKNTVWVLIQLI